MTQIRLDAERIRHDFVNLIPGKRFVARDMDRFADRVDVAHEPHVRRGEIIAVQARGDVMARVWVTAKVRLPMTEYRSIPTGNQTERRVIQTPFGGWTAGEEPGYLTRDESIESIPIGGAWFPVQLQRILDQEVYLEESLRDQEEVKREGAKAALQRLDQLVIDEETVDKWMKFSMIERDTMEVEATAEVIRQIGRPR